MNRFLLIITFTFTAFFAKAQFIGGFGCGDQNAWFDKEIYFYCINNANNGYYGLNLSNVSLVINGETQIDVDGLWIYGDGLFLSKDNGFEFSKGTTVALYVDGYFQNSWTCNTSNPTAIDVAKRLWDLKPRGRSNIGGKNILKILRKFKR
ncbi:MAG: hypothetical protein NC548_39925 [Lachnospiraceae bacterium]|nr:hypothetical protein [Lachnospiraceae bacterium]